MHAHLLIEWYLGNCKILKELIAAFSSYNLFNLDKVNHIDFDAIFLFLLIFFTISFFISDNYIFLFTNIFYIFYLFPL